MKIKIQIQNYICIIYNNKKIILNYLNQKYIINTSNKDILIMFKNNFLQKKNYLFHKID